MENIEQLRHNLALAQTPPLTAEQVRTVDAVIAPVPERLLNPALWRTSNE